MTANPSLPWPWEQLEGEPARDYERFCNYLHLGGSRTFAAAARVSDCSEALIRKNAAAWQWKERAASYDRAFLADLNARIREDVGRDRADSLATFGRQQALQAESMFTAAGLLLQLCVRSTQKLLEADQSVPPATISGLASTAGRLLQVANESMARILGVEAAIEVLEQDGLWPPNGEKLDPMPGSSGEGFDALERVAKARA